VYKYSKKFSHLFQYGSYHADTDEKKMSSLFHQGLSPMLREHLTVFQGYTLNELVSASIEQEDTCCAHLEEERKKRPLLGPNGGAPPKYRLVYTPPSSHLCGPPSSQQWSHRPPRQVVPHPPAYSWLAAPPRAPQPAEVEFLCFNYGQIGHFSRECPQPRQGFTPRAPPPPVGQPKDVVRPLSLRVGRANFTMLEAISQWIDWTYMEVKHDAIFDEVVAACRAKHLRDVMSFQKN
jgi:hypothetical protein